MNLSLLQFIIIVAFLGPAQVVPAAQEIPPKNERMGLFAGNGRCAQRVRKPGKPRMGSKLAGALWRAPGAAPQQPLSMQQLLELIAGGYYF